MVEYLESVHVGEFVTGTMDEVKEQVHENMKAEEYQDPTQTWWSGPLLRMACTSHFLYWKCLFFKLFSIWSNWWFVHVISYKQTKKLNEGLI